MHEQHLELGGCAGTAGSRHCAWPRSQVSRLASLRRSRPLAARRRRHRPPLRHPRPRRSWRSSRAARSTRRSATELMAETFAAAVADRRTFRGGDDAAALAVRDRPPPAQRLVPAAARRAHARSARLGLDPPGLTDAEYERIEELAGLAELRARVADAARRAARASTATRCGCGSSRSARTPEVAAALGIAEQAARARVSRALRGLAARARGRGDRSWLTSSPTSTASAAFGDALVRHAARARRRWRRARPSPLDALRRRDLVAPARGAPRAAARAAARARARRAASRCRSRRRAAPRPRSCCARP